MDGRHHWGKRTDFAPQATTSSQSPVDRKSPAFGTETGFAASIWAKLNEAGLMFSDKETRFLEAGLFMAVPLSILIAVLVVSLTFGWFG